MAHRRKKCAFVCAKDSLFSKLLALLVVFALLVCDTAARFASRLARGLAFAATAILSTLAKITRFKSLDMFHGKPPNKLYFI